MNLRDYQKESLESIREAFSSGYRKVAFQLITGGGKSLIAKTIIEKAMQKNIEKKNKRKVFFITKGRKLLSESIEKFRSLQGGIIWAEKTRSLSKDFIIMSADTYIKRPNYYRNALSRANFVIIDEAHDCTSDGYMKLLNDIPEDCKVLGLSATFIKVGDKGHTYWDDIVVRFTGKELQEKGYLPPLDIYSIPVDYSLSGVRSNSRDYNLSDLYEAVSKSKTIYGDILKQYKIHNPEKAPSIAFCINIQHCEDIAEIFRAEGIPTITLHSRLPKYKQKRAISLVDHYFKNKIGFVLCSVNMLSRGVDYPEFKIGIMVRPTKSKLLFFQQTGRLTRKLDGDETPVKLLDFTANSHTHGWVYGRIIPDSKDKKKREKKATIKRIKECPSCHAVNKVTAKYCVVCRAKLTREIEIQYSDGELVKYKPEEVAREIARQMMKRVKQLTKITQLKNEKYKASQKPFWVWFKIFDEFGEKYFYESDLVPDEAKKAVAYEKVRI